MRPGKLTSRKAGHSILGLPLAAPKAPERSCVSIAETKPGTVLSRIVEARRAEVARRQRIVPETVLRIAAKKADPPRDFAGALCRDRST